MSEQVCLIAMGGNMRLEGQPPETTIGQAVDRLALAGATGLTLSRLYRTPAFPPGSGPDFVNAAAALRLDKTPDEVLDLLHRIEADLGRQRFARWGQRTLDLDLLAVGDGVLPNRKTQAFWQGLPPAVQSQTAPDQLVLPHPRLQDRAFVLVPLCEVAPDWRHPTLERSVRQMLLDLPAAERAAIQPL